MRKNASLDMHRYSTGLGLSGSDALIQDFYSGECTNPIHLILDTGLTDQRLAIKAFVSRTLTLKKHVEPPLATEFLEVPCEVRTAEIEKIGGAWPALTSSCSVRS